MGNGVVILKGDVYLNSSFLRGYGIPDSTVRAWFYRNKKSLGLNGEAYILFELIPKSSQVKLPSKQTIIDRYKISEADNDFKVWQTEKEKLVLRLKFARENNWQKYFSEFSKRPDLSHLSEEKTIKYAKEEALWKELLRMEDEGIKGLHSIYLELKTGKYKHQAAFSRFLKRVRKESTGVAIHKAVGNNNAKKILPQHYYWALQIATCERNYSAPQVHEDINNLCLIDGVRKVSLSTVKNILNDPKNKEQIYFAKNGGKIKIPMAFTSPVYAGDQYQVDEYKLQYYYDDGKTFWRTIYMFSVMDIHSRKIVAYNFNERSDRWLFLSTLKMAVRNAGNKLPFEIVSDNHSANQTSELTHFKDDLKKLGVTWIADWNPQRKAELERWHDTFQNKHCKPRGLFFGGSPGDKRPHSRPFPEFTKQQIKRKNVADREGIILLATEAVIEYNNTPLKCEKTPNELFENSEKRNMISIDDIEFVKLFWSKKLIRVKNYTIKHTVNKIQYRYVLKSDEIMSKYFEQKVLVAYDEEDPKFISVFDPKTNQLIDILEEMGEIHGDLANQTDEDRKRIYKHTSRIKQHNKKLNEREERIAEKLSTLLNPSTESYLAFGKEVHGNAEDEAQKREIMLIHGVDPDNLKPAKVKNDLEDSRIGRKLLNRKKVLEGAEKKSIWDKKGSCKVLDSSKYDDDDE